MEYRTRPVNGAPSQVDRWKAETGRLLAAVGRYPDEPELGLALRATTMLWRAAGSGNETALRLEPSVERLLTQTRRTQIRRRAAERLYGPAPARRQPATSVPRRQVAPRAQVVIPRRTCDGRRRPGGRRVVRHSAASGESGESGGGDPPPAAPRWFRDRYGHLDPADQLEALHRLPERDRRAVISYIAVAAEAQRELAPGLRPIGLSIAEYACRLRWQS